MWKPDGTQDSAGDAVIWIVIGIVIAVIAAGGVAALILIKKKKQTPADE